MWGRLDRVGALMIAFVDLDCTTSLLAFSSGLKVDRSARTMRSLDSARDSWQQLQTYSSLQDLKTALRLQDGASAATNGSRSACWKIFLLFETLDKHTWQKTLSSSRSAYNSLRAHFLRFIENPDDVDSGFDPLSQDAEVS